MQIKSLLGSPLIKKMITNAVRRKEMDRIIFWDLIVFSSSIISSVLIDIIVTIKGEIFV